MYKWLLAVYCYLILSVSSYADGVVTINQERGKYDLDFSATYQTYITQDIETAIILPPGYKFVASMPGSRDFVSAGPLQNVMYISCPVDHDVLTNLTLHVITPEGVEEKLIFKLIGKKGSPRILAIEFERPNNSELNRTVEAIKARYTDQMNEKLTEQESDLHSSIHQQTISRSRHFFIKGKRGEIKAEHKGASFILDGLINSRGNTYVYLKSGYYQQGCEIIKLLWIGERKQNSGNADFISVSENEDGSFTYVYAVPEISIPKHGKTKRIRMQASIWSKTVTLNFRAS